MEEATEEASSEGVKAVFSEAEAGAGGETACAVPSAKTLKRDSGAGRGGGGGNFTSGRPFSNRFL